MIEHDVIGRIAIPNEDPDAEPVYLPGWHVNMPRLPKGWEVYQVFTDSPLRVYAGAETVHLRFADEAEWLAALEALEVLEV